MLNELSLKLFGFQQNLDWFVTHLHLYLDSHFDQNFQSFLFVLTLHRFRFSSVFQVPSHLVFQFQPSVVDYLLYKEGDQPLQVSNENLPIANSWEQYPSIYHLFELHWMLSQTLLKELLAPRIQQWHSIHALVGQLLALNLSDVTRSSPYYCHDKGTFANLTYDLAHKSLY